MKDNSKDWLRLRKEHPAIESTEPKTKNLRDQWLKRKAQAEAARHLAQQAHENNKVSKADWVCIVVLTWVCVTVLYMAVHNLM
tara:strand:- start:300 stop:548 length:249 start_codon:yes stop_codon:yes gene_type:complete